MYRLIAKNGLDQKSNAISYKLIRVAFEANFIIRPLLQNNLIIGVNIESR